MIRVLAAPLGMVLLSILAVGWVALAPGGAGDRPILAVFPPGFDRDATYRAVGSTRLEIVADGALANSIIVRAVTEGEFAALHRVGALLLLDPVMTAGCGKARPAR